MIALIVVTVVFAGMPIASSEPAFLQRETVLAPLVPVISRIAQLVDVGADGTVFIERGERSVRLHLGGNAFVEPDGSVYVPLAEVVRGLGGSVRYDAVRRVAAIDMPASTVLATPTPFDQSVPTVAPTAVFTPQPRATPRPTPSGIPRPRRTPVPVVPSYP